MRYSITVNGESLAELRANLAQAQAELDSGKADKGKASRPAPEDDEEPPATKKAARKPAAEDDDEPARLAKPKAKPAAEDDELDYETVVRPAVVALSKDHGRDAALEVLEKFTNPATDEPCTKGAEVDPADYGRLMAAIKKARAKLGDD